MSWCYKDGGWTFSDTDDGRKTDGETSLNIDHISTARRSQARLHDPVDKLAGSRLSLPPCFFWSGLGAGQKGQGQESAGIPKDGK